eukprot:TRINITY_DN3104_c0_g1_i1.p1 TRINITY_DN3104_c0_g1~~TRINITY_DN3104_c0_g1_i1.p1  ORF type:complete len:172 (+),score=26.50 TRINITY_DN3104_c0_g1_i1:973-1488(+)
MVALINGVIAGLAGVTPASGYITTQPTLALGVVLGVASYFSALFVKRKLRIDDALDVSSVHGLTGAIGSISIGLIATKSANPGIGVCPSQAVEGWFYDFSDGRQLWVQLVATLVAAAYAATVTFIIAYAVDKTIGLRVSPEQEESGLDSVEHGEQPYDNLHSFDFLNHREL